MGWVWGGPVAPDDNDKRLGGGIAACCLVVGEAGRSRLAAEVAWPSETPPPPISLQRTSGHPVRASASRLPPGAKSYRHSRAGATAHRVDARGQHRVSTARLERAENKYGARNPRSSTNQHRYMVHDELLDDGSECSSGAPPSLDGPHASCYERRVDEADGGLYTFKEFVQCYGNAAKWHSSAPPTSEAQSDAQAAEEEKPSTAAEDLGPMPPLAAIGLALFREASSTPGPAPALASNAQCAPPGPTPRASSSQAAPQRLPAATEAEPPSQAASQRLPAATEAELDAVSNAVSEFCRHGKQAFEGRIGSGGYAEAYAWLTESLTGLRSRISLTHRNVRTAASASPARAAAAHRHLDALRDRLAAVLAAVGPAPIPSVADTNCFMQCRVPADNSCLYHCISAIFHQGMSARNQTRTETDVP